MALSFIIVESSCSKLVSSAGVQPNVKLITNRYPFAKIEVMTQQPIKKGDEICIDYFGFGRNSVVKFHERQKQIEERYSFKCQCKKCEQGI